GPVVGRYPAIISRETCRHGDVREATLVYEMAIASGQQGRTGRGADSAGVEIGITETVVGQAVQCRCTYHAAESAGSTESDVVQYDPYHVGGACRRFGDWRPPFF